MSTDITTSESDLSSVFDSCAGTHVGMRREENQDSHIIFENEKCSCFVVADGMGGAQGGAVASSMAIEVFKETIEGSAHDNLDEQVISEAIAHANATVFKLGNEDPSLSGMGTTFVGAIFIGEKMFIFNVGDSRIYRLRDERLTLLTEDHTLIMDLIRSGAIDPAQAENHPVSHMLTRSLGPAEEVVPDCFVCEDGPARGDRYIICSDGLYNMVSEIEIARILSEHSLDKVVEESIKLANENGGTDNITVIALEVGEGFSVGPEKYRSEPSGVVRSEQPDDEDTMELHLDEHGIISAGYGQKSSVSVNGASTEEDVETDKAEEVEEDLEVTQELQSPIISENVDLMEFRHTSESESASVEEEDEEEVVEEAEDPRTAITEVFDREEIAALDTSDDVEPTEQPHDESDQPRVTEGPYERPRAVLDSSRLMTFCLVFFFGVAVTLISGLLLRYQRLSALIDQSAISKRNQFTQAAKLDARDKKVKVASTGEVDDLSSESAVDFDSTGDPSELTLEQQDSLDTPGIEVAAVHGLSNTQVEEITRRKKQVEDRIIGIEEKLTLLNRPFSGDVGQRLKEASKELTAHERAIDDYRAQIDVATRKVAVWYGRRKRLQDTDHVNLATEVAASDPKVGKAQDAFNEATRSYIREMENSRYDPNNLELKKKVSEFAELRNKRFEELRVSVAKSIDEQAEKSHQRITELALARDEAEQKLEDTRAELQYLRVLMSGNKQQLESLKSQLTDQLAASRSELQELLQVLP